MPSSIENVQDALLQAVKHLVPAYSVEEQDIPDIDTLQRDSQGRVKKYVTVQFGTTQATPGPRGKSMVGARGDDYIVPLYVQVVGPTPSSARRAANLIWDGLIGASIAGAGDIRPRLGGAQIPIKNSDGATEAYVSPISFGVVTTLG